MRCPYCNNQLSDNAAFCSQCGQMMPTKDCLPQESTQYWSTVKAKRKQDEASRKKCAEEIVKAQERRKLSILGILILLCVLSAIAAYFFIFKPSSQYNNAIELLSTGEYTQAKEIFDSLNNFKDSKEKLTECQYLTAVDFYNKKDYDEAIKIFQKIRKYNDSTDYIQKCENGINELKYGALMGVYTGCYSAGQGETGLTLTIYADGPTTKAIFEFYNLPGKDNAKEGSFSMIVTAQDDSFTLEAEDWIDRPSGYTALNLEGKLYGNIFCGQEPTYFVVAKTNDAATGSVNYDIPADAIEWNGHRYYCFAFENFSCWEEAEAYCESIGGHLAVISSAEENSTLHALMKSSGYDSAYFGYSDNLCEGSWKWVNGEETRYTNWHTDEPNAQSQGEDYAMFYYKFDNGTWNDGSWNDDGVTFICEWE